MDGIIYKRAYSSYICIENCRGEYLLLHACLYDSYLPRYFLPCRSIPTCSLFSCVKVFLLVYI